MLKRVFLAGGFGKTAKALATRLSKRDDVSLVLSSRTGKVAADFDHEVVRFDWTDPSTLDAPYTNGALDAVYIVSTSRDEPLEQVQPFLDLAIKRGTKRFVFLARAVANLGDKTGPGLVWQYFIDQKVDFTVLRPHWFMENLLFPRYTKGIKDDNAIYSYNGESAVPWTAVDDIATVAEQALLVDKSYNTDIVLTGPQQLDYFQVTEIIAKVTGRPVKFEYKSKEELKAWLQQIGLPPFLVEIMMVVEKIKDDWGVFPVSDNFEKYTGKKATTMEEFITRHKHAFA